MKAGKVYLVGAGPGDPKLITQKGLECLATADVIIYDRLLDKRLLDSAPPEAEKIYAGKTTGEHATPQDKINRWLVAKAREGKTVVRLKGGDPFVLGRGGEEAEALAENGIPFEVVPGVTSAVSVPAYAGIPVTHRGLASSFAVITGHEDPDKIDSSINWEKLATGVDTLVFLMGMQNLPEIVEELLAHGRPADTPVAVIEHGASPGQKTVVSNLEGIAARVREQALGPPAVIVVGEVVRLREKLRWFDKRPLSGKRVLVTRARHQASTLSRLLAEHGAEPVELPTIDIQPMADNNEFDQALARLNQYHFIIFTSVNGVEAFFRRLYELKLDARALKGLTVVAIGPATARCLETKGVVPDYMPGTYTSDGILAGLRSQGIKDRKLLLPRADIADGRLAGGIRQMGGDVHEVAIYQTVPAEKTLSQARQMLLSGEIDVITFTSSSTVTNLLNAIKGEKLAMNHAIVACIGPRTADTAAKAGLKVNVVAEEHTIPGLVAALEKYFKQEE